MVNRFVAAVLLLAASTLAAQDVKTTTTHSSTGDIVVRVEGTVAQSPQAVWRLFSTEKGLQCWVAPVVRLDMRIGGKIETNYDAKASIGGPGTITLGIVNYVEAEFLTLKVKLNDAFSKAIQAEDGNLQEVIRLEKLPGGGTRIISTMIGWGSGPEWARAAEFFAKGNEASYKDLAKCAAHAQSLLK
jgi:uncharacterized protein YndB with AHSA1/START domain